MLNLKLEYFRNLMQRTDSLEKTLMLGKTEDEIVEWRHQLDEYVFEQALGAGDGQGCLACYSPCCCKDSDMTDRLNCNELIL